MKWLSWLPPYIISASPSTASCSPRSLRGSSCQFRLRWAAWLAVRGKAVQHMWILCSPECLGFIYAMHLSTIFHVSGADYSLCLCCLQINTINITSESTSIQNRSSGINIFNISQPFRSHILLFNLAVGKKKKAVLDLNQKRFDSANIFSATLVSNQVQK